jgi:hypothetical protein
LWNSFRGRSNSRPGIRDSWRQRNVRGLMKRKERLKSIISRAVPHKFREITHKITKRLQSGLLRDRSSAVRAEERLESGIWRREERHKGPTQRLCSNDCPTLESRLCEKPWQSNNLRAFHHQSARWRQKDRNQRLCEVAPVGTR